MIEQLKSTGLLNHITFLLRGTYEYANVVPQ